MFFKQLWLVIRQTFLTRVKTGGYWMLVISPIAILALIAGITFVTQAMSNSETPKVAVVNQPQLAKVLNDDKNLDISVTEVTSQDIAEKKLADEKFDGVLVKQNGKFIYTSTTNSHEVNQSSLQTTLNQYTMFLKAQKLNLSNEDLTNLMTPSELRMVVKSTKGDADAGEAAMANYGLAAALGVLIFIFLSAYVGMIAQEIANEKSSRIMEILLASTSPAVQFFGKIGGITLLSVLHGAIYLVAVGVFSLVAPKNEMLLQVKSSLVGVDWGFALMTIAIVLVAIMLYIVSTAMVAAMVNDLSQVQQAVAPVSYLSIISYMLTFMLSGNAHNVLLQVLSFVPFFSQTLMPARLGLQYATMTDAFIALILEIIALIALSYYGLRVYKRNVLTYREGSLAKPILQGFKHMFKKDAEI